MHVHTERLIRVGESWIAGCEWENDRDFRVFEASGEHTTHDSRQPPREISERIITNPYLYFLASDPSQACLYFDCDLFRC